MVMSRLRSLDEIAYVRFASVYRSFRDIEEFRAELDQMAREKPAILHENGASKAQEEPDKIR